MTASQMESVWGQMLVQEMILDLAVRANDHETAREAGRLWHRGVDILNNEGRIMVPTDGHVPTDIVDR